MARLLVTGSSQGIGAQTAKELIAEGHTVVVHARNEERREAAAAANPRAAAVVLGRYDSITSTRLFADAASEQGRYDVIVHNAARGPNLNRRRETEDELELLFQVNVVAPYILTCVMPRPQRIIYVGSDKHFTSDLRLDDAQWTTRTWDGQQAFADSKLYVTMLAMEVADRFQDAIINTVHLGWVKEAMAGPHATRAVIEGAESLTWLATSDDPIVLRSGQYLVDHQVKDPHPLVHDAGARAELMAYLQELTGLSLPS